MRFEAQAGFRRETTQLAIGLQGETVSLRAIGQNWSALTADLKLHDRSAVANNCQEAIVREFDFAFDVIFIYPLNFPVSVKLP
jgi:hypothetical protein